ncbi:ChaN family lipoprotein [Hymenobacter setariae]|uniref:ChaN family lipoprotein n=1 Tax=Hymenobacter setariae TaxID=2594794 RepID=A0A558BPW1_9BACT|nr:ChaN family lipoprotein [Hymenobacter setariae]TVT38541.1 ChaN family lipoprotein [Hymenobacter setariae]
MSIFPSPSHLGRRWLLRLLPLLSFTLADRPAYRLFTAQGQAADYDQMLTQLAQADVVFFGEQHNDPMAHWLELQVAKDLQRLKGPGKLVLGMEMFERDVQPLVAQYAAGTLPDTAFERQSRPWPNYATDYRPLLQFARQEKIAVVATNAPRRYAQQVARGSLTALDALPANEKAYLAPLPLKVDFELPGYKKMAAMFGDATAHGGGGRTIIQAQALKDATMAYTIHRSLGAGQTLLHLNGSYHSDNHDGIVAYLRADSKKPLRVQTLSVVTQSQLQQLDQTNMNVADYLIVVPEDMTKTY